MALNFSTSDSPVACPSRNPVPFSTGETVIAFRITCYPRHHKPETAFRILLEAEDGKGVLLAQTITRPISITDDHKQIKPARSNHPDIRHAYEKQTIYITQECQRNTPMMADLGLPFALTCGSSRPRFTHNPPIAASASFPRYPNSVESGRVDTPSIANVHSAAIPDTHPQHTISPSGYLTSPTLDQPRLNRPYRSIKSHSATTESPGELQTAPFGVSDLDNGHAAVEDTRLQAIVNHLSASIEEDSSHPRRFQPSRISEGYQRLLDSIAQSTWVSDSSVQPSVSSNTPANTETGLQRNYVPAGYSRSNQVVKIRARVNPGGPQVDW